MGDFKSILGLWKGSKGPKTSKTERKFVKTRRNVLRACQGLMAHAGGLESSAARTFSAWRVDASGRAHYFCIGRIFLLCCPIFENKNMRRKAKRELYPMVERIYPKSFFQNLKSCRRRLHIS